MALVANQPNNAWYQRRYHNKIPRQAECRATLDTAYAGQGAAPSVAIQFADVAGGTAIAYTCAAGDLLVGFLYAEGGAPVLTTGATAGFTFKTDVGVASDRGAIWYKVATGAEITFGHSLATRCGIVVARPSNGVAALGAAMSKVTVASGTSMTFPALNTDNDDGTSKLVGQMVTLQGSSVVLPSGLANLDTPVSGAGQRRSFLLHVTSSPVNWVGGVVTWTTSGTSLGQIVEIKVTAA